MSNEITWYKGEDSTELVKILRSGKFESLQVRISYLGLGGWFTKFDITEHDGIVTAIYCRWNGDVITWAVFLDDAITSLADCIMLRTPDIEEPVNVETEYLKCSAEYIHNLPDDYFDDNKHFIASVTANGSVTFSSRMPYSAQLDDPRFVEYRIYTV